jgi:hypothetical protein
VRHEDTVVVTESGCENLAPKWSGSPCLGASREARIDA